MTADCTPDPSRLLGVDDALRRLLDAAAAPDGSELVPLDAALNRVLASPLVSRLDVPPWDYSSMDGYALRCADLAHQPLPISQRIAAGQSPQPLEPGSCARIFTGAPIPPGADAVAMQEVVSERGGNANIEVAPDRGENIRRAGEDIVAGSEVAAVGTRLRPQHLGLAAAVGAVEVAVYPRLRVAFLATGDELVPPGEPLGPGRIYNVNRYTAHGLLTDLGCEVIDLGIVPDDLEATCEALQEGAAKADLILASGGVSVGEEDHIRPALERLGAVEMWQIAVRPGKPLVYGRVGSTPFIGSPGNPVSLFVTFGLFVAPYIRKQQGELEVLPRVFRAVADFDWPNPDRRREYQRARLRYDETRGPLVSVHPSRSSGVLSSVTWADGLVVIPEGQKIQSGDRVDFLPMSEMKP